MIEIKEEILKAGDVLLMPRERSGVYNFAVSKMGKIWTDIIFNLIDAKYVHAELYAGNGWVIAGWTTGVKLVKYSADEINQNFHIFRGKTVNPEEIKKNIFPQWNKPYDLTSLWLNTVSELLGSINLEKWFENEVVYEDEAKLICSELIARIFENSGYHFFSHNLEYISPQDIAEDCNFIRIK